jgi:hypothetical protein
VIHGVTGLDLAWTVVVILVVVLVAVVPATWPGSAGRRRVCARPAWPPAAPNVARDSAPPTRTTGGAPGTP